MNAKRQKVAPAPDRDTPAEELVNPRSLKIDSHNFSGMTQGGEGGGAGAEEGVEDEVAFGGGGEENALEKGERLLRGMLAEFFLPGFGRGDRPDGLHLLAASDFLHQLVVELVAGLFIFRGPDDRLGGVGEIAAGKIGRRIGFDPSDVVQELEFELLHGEADGMDHVAGAADPDGAIGLENALAGGEPGAIELMVGVSAAGTVPFAFIDADHAAGVAGDAVVREEVGRIGEDEVDGVGGEGGENVEAIALEDADVCVGSRKTGAGRCESAFESRGTGLSCADLRILADWDAKRATIRIVDRTVTCVKVDQSVAREEKADPCGMTASCWDRGTGVRTYEACVAPPVQPCHRQGLRVKRRLGFCCHFSHPFRGGLSYGAPPFDAAAGSASGRDGASLASRAAAALLVTNPPHTTVTYPQSKSNRTHKAQAAVSD